MLKVARVEVIRYSVLSRCRYKNCFKQATVIVKDLDLMSRMERPKIAFCTDHVIEYLEGIASTEMTSTVELYVYRRITSSEESLLKQFLEKVGFKWLGIT